MAVSRRTMLTHAPIAVLATACGSSAASQPAAASKKPATVVVHSRAGTGDHSAFQQTRIPLFKQQFPSIDVRYEDIASAELRTKLLVMAAGGNIGDMAWNSTFTGSHELLAKDVFQPVERLVKADKFDIKPYFPASLDTQRYQGQLHGLSFIGHYGCNAMYYNVDLLTKSGVQPPPADANWTVDNLVDMGRKVVAGGSAAGFEPSVGIQECGVAWLRGFGGELLTPDGKKCVIDSPESVAALQWLSDTVNKLHLAPDYADSSAKFEQSQLAIMQQTLGKVAEFQRPASRTHEFKWDVTVIPKGPSGKRGTQGTGTGYALTKLSKAPEAGWEWIKFITNKDNGVEQVFGGGGSPGARTDVWNDAKLHSLSPIYGLMVKVFTQPGPFHAPANSRTDEVIKAVDGALKPLWDGTTSAKDAARAAADAASAILAQPA